MSQAGAPHADFPSPARARRVGLWLIGAFGGVASTVALGLAALRRRLIDTTSLVTALPHCSGLDLDDPGSFVLGGHDIRRDTYVRSVGSLHQRSNVFEEKLIEACQPDLAAWSENVRPGTVLHAGDTIARMADMPEVHRADTARYAVETIQTDLLAFKEANRLDQVVVVNVASTEPPFVPGSEYDTPEQVRKLLESRQWNLPASTLYAWSAIDLGLPFVNFTPSLGATIPAFIQHAVARKSVVAGQDGKTGETLLKTVLAPMFALRNWQILSWVGHNIFGNRDGLVLDDPLNKASKIRTKDKVVSSIVGYKPQSHVSIEYIESLDDWKTAWDHIHFRGFLDVKMTLQFIWQGCDSILAAPLVIDLARLALLSQRRGETGVLKHLACFFKNPMEVEEHDFFRQFMLLEEYIASVRG
jgi:myo-inositol-1-phosphate synthase